MEESPSVIVFWDKIKGVCELVLDLTSTSKQIIDGGETFHSRYFCQDQAE